VWDLSSFSTSYDYYQNHLMALHSNMYLFSLEKNNQTTAEFAKTNKNGLFLLLSNHFFLSHSLPVFLHKIWSKLPTLKKKDFRKLKQKRSDELINLTDNFVWVWVLKEILFKLEKLLEYLIKMFQKFDWRNDKEKHLRYLSDFFSAIVKCIWKKYSKKVLISSLQSL